RHAALGKNHWSLLGGIGGERLWFSPEYAYNWKGKPDVIGFKNYKIQKPYDPGRYRWGKRARHWASWHMKATLRDYRDNSRVTFQVERTVAAAPCLFDSISSALRYVGIRYQHVLKMIRAKPGQRVGLWHLIQMPAGSHLLIPTIARPRPTVYCDAYKRNGWK